LRRSSRRKYLKTQEIGHLKMKNISLKRKLKNRELLAKRTDLFLLYMIFNNLRLKIVTAQMMEQIHLDLTKMELNPKFKFCHMKIST
jgi:hypothetical protein